MNDFNNLSPDSPEMKEAASLLGAAFDKRYKELIGFDPDASLNPLGIDIISDLVDKIVKLQPTFGDPNVDYVCMFAEDIEHEGEPMKDKLLDEFSRIRNVRPMPINGSYLPDKKTIYFMPDSNPPPIKFRLPYTDHLSEKGESK